jgi:small conductance mechanosensitive channel
MPARKLFPALLFILLWSALPTLAQQTDTVAEAVDSKGPLSLEEVHRQSLDAALALIESDGTDVRRLQLRADETEGLMRQIFETRMDELSTEVLTTAVNFAQDIADKRDAGYDVSDYFSQAEDLLKRLPMAAEESIARHVALLKLPDTSSSPSQQTAADETLFRSIDNVYSTYRVLLKSIQQAERFEIDTTASREFLSQGVANGVANLSAYLDFTQTRVSAMKSASAASPGDAELTARLKIGRDRIQRIAGAIEGNLKIMKELGLPASHYQKQLLTVTGEIKTSLFSIDVVGSLLRSWGQAVTEYMIAKGPAFLFRLLIFVAIIYVFSKLAKLVQKLALRTIDVSTVKVSQLLRRMVSSTSRNIVLLLGIMIAFSQIGISLGPLLTGLGIAGFIVGFALQDSLSNFASGMMILLYRPFDVGDTIEAAGTRGRVSHMSLVNTTIMTFDNQSLIVPNNKIWQDVIRNVTAQKELRVDMEFGISYDEDIDRVDKILMDVVKGHPLVLKDPAPDLKVGSFGDSSVNILCRPWVKTEHYWEVFWDLNRQVKQAFDREGVVIPFPQRDVHIFNDGEGETAQPEIVADSSGNA